MIKKPVRKKCSAGLDSYKQEKKKSLGNAKDKGHVGYSNNAIMIDDRYPERKEHMHSWWIFLKDLGSQERFPRTQIKQMSLVFRKREKENQGSTGWQPSLPGSKVTE